MASAAGSLFARTYAGHTGVDPYTTAVSDVYQDLFGEGIFTGKGLYDVDAFAAALEGRVPENALLSHDLFEGLYARTALVTDVEVVDDYPSSVLAHARRQHRWVRGDWQILWWLLPVRAVADAAWRATGCRSIARWKILDNLRRSLMPPATLALLRGRLDGPARAPAGLDRDRRWRRSRSRSLSRLLEILRRARGADTPAACSCARALEDLSGLPPRAARCSSRSWRTRRRACCTPSRVTLVRLASRAGACSSGRRRPPAPRAAGPPRLRAFVRRMAASPAVAWSCSRRSASGARRRWPCALPILALWVAAPGDRVRAQPAGAAPPRCRSCAADRAYPARRRAQDLALLRDVRRPPTTTRCRPTTSRSARTQAIAHRTSPTNIGLGLLATLAAHDLGFIDDGRLVRRVDATLDDRRSASSGSKATC